MPTIEVTEFKRKAGHIYEYWVQLIGALVHHTEFGRGEIADFIKGDDGRASDVVIRTDSGVRSEHLNNFQIHVREFNVPQILWWQLTNPEAYLEQQRKDTEEARKKQEQEARRAEGDKIHRELKPFLSRFDFQAAARRYEELGSPHPPLYKQITEHYGRKFLKTRIAEYLRDDEEKARALVNIADYLLVKARAGSGKTTLIAARTIFLIETQNVLPRNILLLAFNHRAAEEMGNRIRVEYKLPDFRNARTFHSFAYGIVHPKEKEKLLYDKDGDEGGHYTKFVKKTVIGIWSPIFLAKLYWFFRKELEEIESHSHDLPPDEYYIYRRNLRQVTLNGESVKSSGEKIIADFLFEHGINYKYEDRVFVPHTDRSRLGTVYYPDFTIWRDKKPALLRDKKPAFRWEHWGIDLADTAKKVPDWWTNSWDDYRKQIDWKREFWRNRKQTLIETTIVDSRNGREAFEHLIKVKLESFGISCVKRTDEELHEAIEHRGIDRMTLRFAQFIQKAKQQRLTPEKIRERIRTVESDDRTRVFLELASNVYEAYQRRLREEGYIDFYDLLIRAEQQIHRDKGTSHVSISGDDHFTLSELTHIMTDEYQDFTELFDGLIQALRQFNPSLNILAVGDDWQAINAFAGSDLRFFERFPQIYDGAQTELLATNYRSRSKIVEFGNRVMAGHGPPGKAASGKEGGQVEVKDVLGVRLNLPATSAYDPDSEDDSPFVFQKQSGGVDYGPRFLVSQYLKECRDIVLAHKREKIFFLSRKNKLPGDVSLMEFKDKLISWLPVEARRECRERLHVMSAHTSKGLEADVVVVLRAISGEFPLIHPDSVLFRIFGRTEKDEILDERRLFYVACSRAREKLYILTERGKETDFL